MSKFSYTSAFKVCAIVLALFIAAGCVNASTTTSGGSSKTDEIGLSSENNMPNKPDKTVILTNSSNNPAFEYREAYLPENIDSKDSDILAENNVGRDWGIWGHNLHKIVGKNADDSVYAEVDGEVYYGQYCFSSELLYKIVRDYISYNFGDGQQGHSQFVIMPADDAAVCLCEMCVKSGNSEGNATPAVAAMVVKLANEFTGHRFFMGAYGSTIVPPAEVMPLNVGVIVSAINWPLSPSIGGKYRNDFDLLVKSWQERCKHIYVWDYICNFDDYLTPFPVLCIMRQRLQHFRSIGVNGIFLNGSGESYSSFSGLHNYVLAKLMINPDAEVGDLVKKYFHHCFPTAGKMLADRYMQWERSVMKSKKGLNLYASIDRAAEYLGGYGKFVGFYDELCEAESSAKGDERHRIRALKGGLAYTVLELARSRGNIDEKQVRKWLSDLAETCNFADIAVISESGLTVADYVKCWNMSILDHNRENMLTGMELKALTPLDSGYGDLSMLTDCVNGLPCGYHYGWLISSLGKTLEVEIPMLPQARRLEVSFLELPRHRITRPACVELLWQGKRLTTLSADDAIEIDELQPNGRRLVYRFDLSGISDATERVILQVTRSDGRDNHIAVDEIRMKR